MLHLLCGALNGLQHARAVWALAERRGWNGLPHRRGPMGPFPLPSCWPRDAQCEPLACGAARNQRCSARDSVACFFPGPAELLHLWERRPLRVAAGSLLLAALTDRHPPATCPPAIFFQAEESKGKQQQQQGGPQQGQGRAGPSGSGRGPAQGAAPAQLRQGDQRNIPSYQARRPRAPRRCLHARVRSFVRSFVCSLAPHPFSRVCF